MAEQPRDEEAIFLAALEKTTPQERNAFVEGACAGDKGLLQRIRELLDGHDESVGPLDSPPPGVDATIDQPITERPGTVIGRYKLLEQIGEGGFGIVFMAEQEEPVRRKVALKIIKPGMDTKEVIARFEAERQALAIMDHPNIAKVLDAGATESGRPFFVMELVRGVPITDFCDENSLTARERLQLFVSVCQAVQHAHQKGIIHRDIKPSNVLVTMHDDKPVPKVIDFGVAKATNARLTEKTLFTRFAQMVGTPLYMSPEQAQMSGLDVDTRSDIYSLGVLLYELLTGTTPFDQKRIREAAYDELLRIIREEEPPRPSLRISTLGDTLPAVAAHRKVEPRKLSTLVRGELDWIVMKALEKDRSRRYDTATGLSADIERYLSDEPVQACPPTAAYRFKKFARRNKLTIAAATAIVFSLVVGSGVATWQATRARNQARRAIVAEQYADRQRRIAEVQREQAEENFREACDTVDRYFTMVSETTLLDEPGLQPLREQLLNAAVEFYERLSSRGGAEPSLQLDVALAYLRLGQLHHHMDQDEQRNAAFSKGLDLVQIYLEKSPQDREPPQKLAGFWKPGRHMAIVYTGNFDTESTFRVCRQGILLWEQLATDYPKVSGFQTDLGKFYAVMAREHWRVGEREEAFAWLEKSTHICERLVEEYADVAEYRSELAWRYSTLGRHLHKSGKQSDAEGYLDRAVEIRAELPNLMAYKVPLAATDLVAKARVLDEQQRVEEAANAYRESILVWKSLVKRYPHSTEFQQSLDQSKRRLDEYLSGRGLSPATTAETERSGDL